MWFSWLLFSVGVHPYTPNDPTFFILMQGMSDGERRGRECEAAGRAGTG